MKLKTRIALVYSVFVIIIAVVILLFLDFTLQTSMTKNPVLYQIAPGSVEVTIKQIPLNGQYAGAISTGGQFYTQSLNTSEFNSLLSGEVLRRIAIISAFALLFILLSTFLISTFLSRRLLRPVTEIADETSRIDTQKLDLRLKAPNTDDELKKLVGAFNHALDCIQSSFYDLEQFNAFASHELKNSLAVMKTRLEVDYKTGDYKQALDFAIAYVDSVSETVNDVLAISSRQSDSDIEPVDLAMAAAQAVNDYGMIRENITFETPEEGVAPVAGREIWLRRAVANLIDNAVKVSPDGSPVHVVVKQSFDAVIVSVSDSGRGLNERKLDLIWQPFYSTSTQNNGYGLGLAMVRHITDICGGLAWAENNAGDGSTFYLSFPILETA